MGHIAGAKLTTAEKPITHEAHRPKLVLRTWTHKRFNESQMLTSRQALRTLAQFASPGVIQHLTLTAAFRAFLQQCPCESCDRG